MTRLRRVASIPVSDGSLLVLISVPLKEKIGSHNELILCDTRCSLPYATTSGVAYLGAPFLLLGRTLWTSRGLDYATIVSYSHQALANQIR